LACDFNEYKLSKIGIGSDNGCNQLKVINTLKDSIGVSFLCNQGAYSLVWNQVFTIQRYSTLL